MEIIPGITVNRKAWESLSVCVKGTKDGALKSYGDARGTCTCYNTHTICRHDAVSNDFLAKYMFTLDECHLLFLAICICICEISKSQLSTHLFKYPNISCSVIGYQLDRELC